MTQWHFNPPYALHMGGSCAILKHRVVSQEVLRTKLVEVEALINSQPIGYVLADAEDVEPLSPFHFLLLRPHLNIDIDVVQDREVNTVQQWRQVQALTNFFWKRWLREYVPALTERSKWCADQPNLKEGDVVLSIDANQPRGNWLLGRVLVTHQGKDGRVRSAELKTKLGTCTRPANKLCLLQECPPVSAP